MTIDITKRSLDLFLALAADACNWSGEPLFGGNVRLDSVREDRGNLTQLKLAGLIGTYQDRGDTFVTFTEAGKALAQEHGVSL